MKWFVIASLLVTSAGLVHAQNPMLLRWDKAAPFPEPEEELYGIESGGKMYVIGGFSENGKPAPAMVYEYDPGPDKWTKKKPIPKDYFKAKEWNDYHLIVRGNRFQHYVNGIQVVDVLDNDPKGRSLEGILALQIHAGPPMLVEFKDILLKNL